MSDVTISTLHLRQSRYPEGSGIPTFEFLDFEIDGRSLLHTYFPDFDLVSCLLWSLDQQQQEVDRLLLRRAADFPSSRRSLYVCHIDADLGCGAIGAVVENGRGVFTWHTFAYENTYEEPNLEVFKNVGPFMFQEQQYYDALQIALDWARSRPNHTS